jgi:alkanesulfonate monooxygenase SsuD/methylene tetrahydromethanopterin reductase-like flavin-dependent oxidoreductase (luciferase family)
MRFGLLYEHQLPRPWAADAEHRLLHDALEQIELADRLGFARGLVGEHHFREVGRPRQRPRRPARGPPPPAPRSIRLGLAEVPVAAGSAIPPLAGAVATLDLVSDGRVELAPPRARRASSSVGSGCDRAAPPRRLGGGPWTS